MNQSEQLKDQSNTKQTKSGKPDDMSDFAYAAGITLGLSYPILALSTGVRSLYQLLLKEGVTYYFPPAMSGLAAMFYLTATIGFAVRRKWAWRVSVAMLGIETLFTFVIGTLSFTHPDLIGHTVWRHFGADYGYFPLFQPLIGLGWLFSRSTLRAYGIIADKSGKEIEQTETSTEN